MKGSAKTGILILAVVLAAAVGCGIGCAVVMKLSGKEADAYAEHSHTAKDHLELHKRLELTEAQEPEMEALERNFAQRAVELRKPIHAANHELAAALVEDRSHSQRVRDAVDKIHHAQAELQKATIEHIIEMRTVLDDDQFDEFLELTAATLREN